MHCTLSVNFTSEQLKQEYSLLNKLLAKGNCQPTAKSLDQHLFDQISIEPAPIAAVSAAADGLVVGDDLWLMATPVHLVLQRDAFVLHPELPTLPQSVAEAYQLTLNQHFESDGLQFCLGQSGQWYIRRATAPQELETLEACHPYEALGQNINDYSPKGQTSAYWVQKQNEVQMLLFEHPENNNREQKNQLSVNSVWLYGAGRYPSQKQQGESHGVIVSDMPLYLGLAQLQGVDILPLAKTNQEVTQVIASAMGDLQVGLSSVENLQIWLVESLKALQTRSIKQLTLQLGFRQTTLVVDISPRHLWRFWRRSQPLLQYFPD